MLACERKAEIVGMWNYSYDFSHSFIHSFIRAIVFFLSTWGVIVVAATKLERNSLHESRNSMSVMSHPIAVWS